MIVFRPAGERGHTLLDWLDSRHTFSFDRYHDPRWMGFRTLRVLNDDRVAPGRGFGTHPHRDMDILTWVLEGALEHRDSLGNGSVIRPGDVQRMSAGTGISHSEFNPAADAPVHFLQIWIVPDTPGLPPGYEQQALLRDAPRGRLRLVAARGGRDGAVTVHQDVDLWAARLGPGDRVHHALAPGRSAWLHVARGRVALGDRPLGAGDGAGLRGEAEAVLAADEDAEVLLFDLG